MDSAPQPQVSEGDVPAGTQVGEYIIEGKIGEGGFGSVYRANHPMIGKLAAVKVLARRYSSDPEMVSRFASEARAANQIRHRNIIDIFAFGQLDDGRSYYVMELLDGQPLDKLLDETGGLALGDALPILRGIARALDAAHAKGIAHRDLKPENVFLARDSDGDLLPKLLDFGIAKLLGDQQSAIHRTRTGLPIGTPFYMSPEQCRGQSVDHRTDIYSFGCVAYQLLTGTLPFEGDNHLDIMLKQTSAEPVPPSQRALENPVLPPLPEAIDEAIAWCMRKEPGERPPSVINAVRAFEEAAGVAPTRESMQSMPTPSRLTPLPRRTPAQGVEALAQTMAASEEQERAVAEAATKRSSKRPWLLAGLACAAGGLVAFLLLRGGSPAAAPPADHEAPVAVPAVPAEPEQPPVAQPPQAASADETAAEVATPDAAIDEASADASTPAVAAKPRPKHRPRPVAKKAPKPKPEATKPAPVNDPYSRQ